MLFCWRKRLKGEGSWWVKGPATTHNILKWHCLIPTKSCSASFLSLCLSPSTPVILTWRAWGPKQHLICSCANKDIAWVHSEGNYCQKKKKKASRRDTEAKWGQGGREKKVIKFKPNLKRGERLSLSLRVWTRSLVLNIVQAREKRGIVGMSNDKKMKCSHIKWFLVKRLAKLPRRVANVLPMWSWVGKIWPPNVAPLVKGAAARLTAIRFILPAFFSFFAHPSCRQISGFQCIKVRLATN